MLHRVCTTVPHELIQENALRLSYTALCLYVWNGCLNLDVPRHLVFTCRHLESPSLGSGLSRRGTASTPGSDEEGDMDRDRDRDSGDSGQRSDDSLDSGDEKEALRSPSHTDIRTGAASPGTGAAVEPSMGVNRVCSHPACSAQPFCIVAELQRIRAVSTMHC